MREILKERFFKKVTITPGCWRWNASIRKGYGGFHVENNKLVYAHRFSYEIHIGEIPNGLVVCHRCDNPLCVNPDHLFASSQKGNMEDKVSKNRQAKGESHGATKLTNSKVYEIRARYAKGSRGFGTIALSKMYGISRSQIWKIVNNVKWREE